MEIKKYGSVMPAYAKTAYEPPKTKRGKASVKNTDKAEFSSASKSEGAVAGAKASVRKAVESFASPETIAALKSMIADGSYDISAEDVASAILD
ncbi:MAG: flagellar biosynthesis anti-sigma factor FlgM [Oscillospiraceae bacterium]|nr:flagellar biosynthesis anti-sigma factor FlgM [Oscillospiraceae bacterium]